MPKRRCTSVKAAERDARNAIRVFSDSVGRDPIPIGEMTMTQLKLASAAFTAVGRYASRLASKAPVPKRRSTREVA